MKNPAHYSRRAFLREAGLGLGGLGLLPTLGAERAYAKGHPRRLMIVVQTNGTIADAFFPRGEGADLANLTLPAITEPLEPHKQDLLFVENLELRHFNEQKNNGGGHDNYGVTFVGLPGEQRDTGDPRGFRPPYPVSPSIDQHIVDGMRKRGVLRSPLPKVHLGCQIENAGTNQKRCFWRDRGQPVAPENNPARVAGSFFGGSALGDPSYERLRIERKSMLDYLGRDLAGFARRFGQDDRIKIEAHLNSVREVENQITALQNVRCAAPAVPGSMADGKAHPDERYPDVMDLQLKLAVNLLACDVAPIVTVQLQNGHGNDVVYSWLGLEGKGKEFPIRDSHDLAHRPGEGNADKIRVETWNMEQFAGLIDRMKAVKEGDGTLLDNTALLWINHMGNGGGHTSTKLPWVIAGRCGGYFKPGRFVRHAGNVPTHGVLIALANALGAPTQFFGDAKYGGEMTALRG